MDIGLSDLAAARLKLLLWQEQAEGERLAVKVVPLTSGCGLPAFALELTEIRPSDQTVEFKGVPFAWKPAESSWLDGIRIDWDRNTDKFSVWHPRPPHEIDCGLNKPGGNL
jgi:Fe-S cluster assembly iron-binding protein IscA